MRRRENAGEFIEFYEKSKVNLSARTRKRRIASFIVKRRLEVGRYFGLAVASFVRQISTFCMV